MSENTNIFYLCINKNLETMATTKKNTTAKRTVTKSNSKTTKEPQKETPLKLTKKQLESFKIHEAAAKAGGELARAGILKPYIKNW